MIVCPRCSKENQDHYKFCLGCGAELPRDNAQPKSFTAPTPPAGVPASSGGEKKPAAPAPSGGGGGASAAAQPAAASPAPAAAKPAPAAQQAAPAPAAQQAASAPAAGPETVDCPSCGSKVPKNFKFCGSCGHDMTGGGGAAQPAAQPAAAPTSNATEGSLILIRPDGSEGESFPLSGETVVGRNAAGPFASDSYMSPQHATFKFGGQGLVVSDMSSLNGVYMRIHPDAPHELIDGAIFRIGQEILRFEAMPEAQAGPNGEELMGSPDPGYLGRIQLVVGKDVYANSYCVPPDGMHLGRERGDIIFPDDGYVSGLHCRIHGEGGKIYLTDVGSSNGTFVRLLQDTVVPPDALLLMGQQLFRVQY